MYITDNGVRPNSTYHKWYSAGLGHEVVTVPAKSCGSAECTYMVAVNGFGASNTSWSIVAATAAEPIVLIDGQPQLDILDEHDTVRRYLVLQLHDWLHD